MKCFCLTHVWGQHWLRHEWKEAAITNYITYFGREHAGVSSPEPSMEVVVSIALHCEHQWYIAMPYRPKNYFNENPISTLTCCYSKLVFYWFLSRLPVSLGYKNARKFHVSSISMVEGKRQRVNCQHPLTCEGQTNKNITVPPFHYNSDV